MWTFKVGALALILLYTLLFTDQHNRFVVTGRPSISSFLSKLSYQSNSLEEPFAFIFKFFIRILSGPWTMTDLLIQALVEPYHTAVIYFVTTCSALMFLHHASSIQLSACFGDVFLILMTAVSPDANMLLHFFFSALCVSCFSFHVFWQQGLSYMVVTFVCVMVSIGLNLLSPLNIELLNSIPMLYSFVRVLTLQGDVLHTLEQISHAFQWISTLTLIYGVWKTGVREKHKVD